MTETRLNRGLIQVYTGDGKGKTTCALGLALRAVGQGFQVFMVQFMKGWGTGEALIAAQRLAPDFTLRHFGRRTGPGAPPGGAPDRPRRDHARHEPHAQDRQLRRRLRHGAGGAGEQQAHV